MLKGKNLAFKVLLVALIVAIPGIMMAVMSNEKLMGNFGLPSLSAFYNSIMRMVVPPKPLPPPTPDPIRPNESYFKIHETNEETPNQSSPYVKKYSIVFDITEENPDLRVDYVEPFVPMSASHYGDEKIIVSPDKKKITVAFTLTSGPADNKYSGWVNGTLTVHTKNIKEEGK